MTHKKVKILFTIPNFDTAGSGKAMLKIIQRLDKNLFEPHIACDHDRGAFFEIVKNSGIPVHLFHTTSKERNRIKMLFDCWRKRKFYRNNNFDLVHSFHYSDEYTEALSVRLAGKKWVYVKKNMNWGGNAWKVRSFLANGILAQNTDMMEHFFNGNNKAVLCGRGVDLQEFFPQKPSEKLRNEFGIFPHTKVLLTVANLVPVKGIEVLLDAIEKVPFDSSQDVRLFIVGDDQNEYSKELKEKATKLTIPVIFTGKRMDVSEFHSISTIFILPTLNKGRKEGSPVSFLEAMASGTYSLGSRIPGLKDQLAELPDQLFEAGNSVELAMKMEKALLMSEEEMNEKIERQMESIKSGFTIDQEVKRHEDFYKRVLKIN